MNFKKLILTTSSCALILMSCSKNDDSKPNNTGVVSSSTVKVTPSEVSFFDQGNTNYKLFSSIATVNKLLVNGEALPVSNKISTYTANFEKLGITDLGDTSELTLIPFIDTKQLDTVKAVITSINPITLTAKIEDSIIKKEPIVIPVSYKNEGKLSYKITKPKTEAVKSVLVERKTFENGTYETIATDLGPETGTVIVKPSDFKKLDTLFYRVTATTESGIKAFNKTIVVIDTEYFNKSSKNDLLETDAFYTVPDFKKTTETNADIVLTNPNNDIFNLLITAKNNTSFVKYINPNEKTFDFGDKLEAINFFTASATKATSITAPKPGEIYIFRKITKTDTKETETYGLLKIDNVESSSGAKITVSVKY